MNQRRGLSGRGAAQPEYDDAYRRSGESTKVERQRQVSVRTGELGLRIAWNCWRNDEYANGFLVLCQLCRHIVKIGGDQHRRSSVTVIIFRILSNLFRAFGARLKAVEND